MGARGQVGERRRSRGDALHNHEEDAELHDPGPIQLDVENQDLNPGSERVSSFKTKVRHRIGVSMMQVKH